MKKILKETPKKIIKEDIIKNNLFDSPPKKPKAVK
jgi:hypothetical protein